MLRWLPGRLGDSDRFNTPASLAGVFHASTSTPFSKAEPMTTLRPETTRCVARVYCASSANMTSELQVVWPGTTTDSHVPRVRSVPQL